jgi:hypothetical protein
MQTITKRVASAETEERTTRAHAKPSRRRPREDLNARDVAITVLGGERSGVDTDLADHIRRRHDGERQTIDVDRCAASHRFRRTTGKPDHVLGATEQLQQRLALEEHRSNRLSEVTRSICDDVDDFSHVSQAQLQREVTVGAGADRARDACESLTHH